MGRKISKDGIEASGYTLEWAPPNYVVDAAGKVRGGYRPPIINNWGRWGDNDQRGTANLIGPQEVVRAARLIETGQIYSLTLPLAPDSPRWPGRNPPIHFFTISGSDLVVGHPTLDSTHVQWADDAIILTLQDSTQWDGLAHFAYQDVMYNGYWAGNVTADGGAKTLGIEHQAESFTGRGVLIDLARHLGIDSLEPRTIITTSLIDEVAVQQGVVFERGDMLLIRTGYQTKWDANSMTHEEKRDWFLASPKFESNCVEWIRKHDFAALCTDCMSPDGFPTADEFEQMGPYETGRPVHIGGLIGLGLTIGELFYLERLAAACADDRKYAFFMCAPPLNIPGAVGSPINPTAIK